MTTSRGRADRPGSPAVIAGCFVLDLMLVVIFAIIGRASHDEGVLGTAGTGLLQTAWPFVVALVAGWVVTAAWRAPLKPLRAGGGIWAVTVVGGMLLRLAAGQGTALPFVIVAAITLLVFLVGWRAIIAVIRSRAAPSTRSGSGGTAA